jgi:hypothetical protein
VAAAGAGAAAEGEGGVADTSEKIRGRVSGAAAGFPEVDEALLHGILGLMGIGQVVTRQKEKGAGVAGVPGAPVVGIGGVVGVRGGQGAISL